MPIEGNQSHPTPHALRLVRNAGLVIKSEPKLVSRTECEILTIKMTCSNWIATSYRLYPSFIQPDAFACFDGCRKPTASQHCHVIRYAAPTVLLEGRKGKIHAIVAENVMKHAKESGFPI